MIGKYLLQLTTLAGLFTLMGCTSKVPQPEDYSGFLSSYSDLKEATSASGKTELRWIAPDYNPRHYDSLVFNPIVYYPVPKPNTQIGQQALDQIRNYTNLQLKNALAEKFTIVEKAGPHSLIFRGAITAVNSSPEGLQFYEVIPIAMIVAGTQMATGYRTMNTSLFFEGEVIDAATRRPVMKVVRKGAGKDLNNASTSLTVNTIKQVIDNMAVDAVKFDPTRQ